MFVPRRALPEEVVMLVPRLVLDGTMNRDSNFLRFVRSFWRWRSKQRRLVLQHKPTSSLFRFRAVSLYPYCLFFSIFDQPTTGRAFSTRERILETETRNHVKTAKSKGREDRKTREKT